MYSYEDRIRAVPTVLEAGQAPRSNHPAVGLPSVVKLGEKMLAVGDGPSPEQ